MWPNWVFHWAASQTADIANKRERGNCCRSAQNPWAVCPRLFQSNEGECNMTPARNQCAAEALPPTLNLRTRNTSGIIARVNQPMTRKQSMKARNTL